MLAIVFVDAAEARQFEAAVRWMFGLPRSDATVRTGGLHAPVAPVPGPGVINANGWGIRFITYYRHPTDGRLAIRVTQQMLDVWQARKGELTAAQRNWVQTRVTSAAEIPADWYVAGELLDDQYPDPTNF